MESNKYCVLMAGGAGTRFWPRSRQSMPKQFLDILGTGKSFLRHTFERFEKLVPVENFMVVTHQRYKELVMQHLPELSEDQILCEPIGRNTAPCFAAEPDALVTVGIKPTRPETGYGYIQVSDSQPISKVKCFTEKPCLELAQTFLQCGEFFWNSGIFIWKVRTIVEAFRRYLPEHHALFRGVMMAIGTEAERNVVEMAYSESRAISIDYGVMEKADNVYVRCGEFGWSDVGTWGSVYQHARKDRYANAAPEEGCYLYDTRNSIVSLPKDKIAVISGLKEYIVVDTEDVLLVCPRAEEQNIRKYIAEYHDEVKFHNGDKHI